MGDNIMVEAVVKGSLLAKTRVKDHAWSIRMNDLFHVPNLHSNLLSVNKFISRSLKVHYTSLGRVVKVSNG